METKEKLGISRASFCSAWSESSDESLSTSRISTDAKMEKTLMSWRISRTMLPLQFLTGPTSNTCAADAGVLATPLLSFMAASRLPPVPDDGNPFCRPSFRSMSLCFELRSLAGEQAIRPMVDDTMSVGPSAAPRLRYADERRTPPPFALVATRRCTRGGPYTITSPIRHINVIVAD